MCHSFGENELSITFAVRSRSGQESDLGALTEEWQSGRMRRS